VTTTGLIDGMKNRSSIPIELVTSSGQVSDLARVLFQERCIAIDTGSNSRHRYPERICLVQVATNSKVYLIDTLAVDDMKPIGEVLAEETVVKVIQGADYDIRCLDREWGFQVRNLFDTFIAARFVGMKHTGLSALIEALLQVQVPKLASIQKSDWSHRPLNQDALNYAARDVWYLLDIQKALEGRLRTLARSTWVSEECARLEEIRYVAPDPETAFQSLKGSHRLRWSRKGDLETTILVARCRGSPSQPASLLCFTTRNSSLFGFQSDYRFSTNSRAQKAG